MVANKQTGFILATTIWMVAILALLAGLFHSYVESQVLQALELKNRVQTDLDMASTGASVRYLLASRRRTLAGLTVSLDDQQIAAADDVSALTPVGNEIRLDGALYRGLGDTFFSIQDQGGLLAINAPSTQRLLEEVLKERLGTQAAKELAAMLADYIDENDRRSFNGAEASRYQAQGLPVPTNWYLRTEQELHDVLGWRDLLAGDNGSEWLALFAISYANALNINTAPAELLQLLLDLSPQEAQQLIVARNNYAFRSLDGVAEALGVINNWQEERFRFFPADNLRVELGCKTCAYSVVQSLQLTQDGFYGPWQMDYSHIVSTSGGKQDHEAAILVEGSIF